jgi:protein phosphatase 2C family protein 2/3
LLRHILSNSCFPENLEQVLSQAFSKTDQTFESEWASGELEGSGTTALAAVLWGRMITVANLGDCRAVVSRRGKALDITQDQKPSSEMELERIEEAGGRVCCEGYLNGVLGVSRAIGNWHVTGDNDILLKVCSP